MNLRVDSKKQLKSPSSKDFFSSFFPNYLLLSTFRLLLLFIGVDPKERLFFSHLEMCGVKYILSEEGINNLRIKKAPEKQRGFLVNVV